MTPSFCSQCATPLPPDAKFCPQCAHPVASQEPSSAPGWEGEVIELLRQGNPLGAIKLYRERTHLGLKESKEAVEAIARRHNIPLSSSSSQGMGCLRFFLCLFFGLMIATAGMAAVPALGQIVSPLVCKNGLKVQSNSYSYKPGQRGVTRNFYCEDRPGERRAVNGRVMLLSIPVYTVLLYLLSWISSFFRGIFKRTSGPPV